MENNNLEKEVIKFKEDKIENKHLEKKENENFHNNNNNLETLEGIVIYKKKEVILYLNKQGLSWKILNNDEKINQLTFENVVGVENHIKRKECFVIYCFPKIKNLRERKVYIFSCKNEKKCSKWIQAIRCVLKGLPIMELAPKIQLLILINPFGGKKKAKEIWNNVKTMFEIANIQCNIIETKYSGHAYEIAQNIEFDINGIVCISGDGLIYEIINGLMNHKNDWKKAIKIPLGIIPGGSGNGLAATLGVLDPYHAAFNIIKGKTYPLDICSVLHQNKRYYIFLSLTWAIIADIDKDSEKFRWMGESRFTFTAIQKILSKQRTYFGKITYIPVKDEKNLCTMYKGETCLFCNKNVSDQNSLILEENNGPKLLFISESNFDNYESISIEDEFSFFVLSSVSHISSDTKVAPYAHICDGAIDLIFSKKLTKTKMAKLLLNLEKGDHIKLDEVYYNKIKAIILEPKENKGNIMLDGEYVNVDTIKLEVHKGLARIFRE